MFCFKAKKTRLLVPLSNNYLDSLPLLEKIFNVVMQKENHQKIMIQRDSTGENEVAFAVNTRKP